MRVAARLPALLLVSLDLACAHPRPPLPDGSADYRGSYFRSEPTSGTCQLTISGERYRLLCLDGRAPRPRELREAGLVRESGGLVAFLSEDGATGSHKLGWIATPLVWGPRRYLLTGDTRDFCRQVAEGGEPRKDPGGSFFLRDGDERKPVPAGTVPTLCGVR